MNHTTDVELNLARKLRPKSFAGVKGQDLCVKMLKNGLYRKKFFPLYIFSGQRGCGKTSTARIFAAALNCEKLGAFQSDPRSNEVPCTSCDSCIATFSASHSDFVEIDAASHTGVDNARNILESAAFMPLAGSFKIYLIDEAHMLSRAAFNAFLKVLEEPPAGVIFILATTELHKIPDTVASRSFQLFFNPLETTSLHKHLRHVCTDENIEISDDALDVIIAQSEGSVRDALNLLERVRLVSGAVSEEMVLHVLGRMSNDTFFELADFIVDQRPKELLESLAKHNFNATSPQAFWGTLLAFYRSLVWVKYGVREVRGVFERDTKRLEQFAARLGINRLHALMQLMWSGEEIFMRSAHKHAFLETLLLHMAQQVNIADLEELLASAGGRQEVSETVVAASSNASHRAGQPALPGRDLSNAVSTSPEWGVFLAEIDALTDPLLVSIFKQAQLLFVDKASLKVTISLSTSSAFFRGKVAESKGVIVPLIEKAFGVGYTVTLAQGEGSSNSPAQSPRPSRQEQREVMLPQRQFVSHQARGGGASSSQKMGVKTAAIDVSDKEKWPKAHLLESHFSGTLRKVVK